MKRSTLVGSLHLPMAALVIGAGILTQACAFGQNTGSNSADLGGGGGSTPDGGVVGEGGASFEGGSSSDGGATGEGGWSWGDAGGGSDGGYAYAYAFIGRKAHDRHHVLQLADGAHDSVAFTWRDAAGVAPAADLWVDEAGKEVLQVTSVNGHPFVRVGLELVPLTAGTNYDLTMSRVGNTIDVALVGADHQVLASVQLSGDAVDVVLPGEFFRPSVVTSLR